MLRTRRAIDATSEAARRARKLLFATALWDQDASHEPPAAKADDWIATTFADAISARRIKTSHGTFGYLRLWTFDVDNTNRYVEAVAASCASSPARDSSSTCAPTPAVSSTPPSSSSSCLSPRHLTARFALRATPAMVDIAEADGNGADLADWATSTRLAYELGEEFSQHLPISSPELQRRLTGLPRPRRRRRQPEHLLLRRPVRRRHRRLRHRDRSSPSAKAPAPAAPTCGPATTSSTPTTPPDARYRRSRPGSASPSPYDA